METQSTTPTTTSSAEGTTSTLQPASPASKPTVPQRKKLHKHKKHCWLCKQGKLTIDYKDTEFLKSYLRRYNKILIHKVSGNCLKHQHQLSQAIKRARYISLLPFVAE
ncbi:30S ribosomal protein S18 [Candidatus Mycoplasma haematolamae str. Purdue]|uniref:Small ribosomal subunit protein bS18 n=1 Tax=Mycoplasma haematolamae (strain Purdue) TaxID=1212765 RepID=I7CIC3_MYCHA|nr:30S ribosomal protein S18 [Candidatus Mycoplasma haematolamae]AFO51599.1 30S ribosomal protein S18 [Candidatus Mycoplasma haematolamae str. Purdue]